MTTPTDWKALCAELLSLLDGIAMRDPEMDGGMLRHRARAALAQPEPADLSGVSWPDPGPITARAVFVNGKCYLLDTEPEPEPVPAMRKALEIWGCPAAPPAPEPGEVGELVAWMRSQVAIAPAAQTQWAKRFFRIATLLQQLSAPAAAVVPVPVLVSERLPGPEDCWPDGHDKVGCCWLWAPDECLGRWEVQCGDWASDVDGEYTHWLPHHALPVPWQKP
jgi:hypothetical protein